MAKTFRRTRQRESVRAVIEAATRPLRADEVLFLAREQVPELGLATVYRTVRLFEEAGLLDRLDFGDGRSRYEETSDDHHDHLIDMNSGKVFEFHDAEVERLQIKIAERYGFKLIGHRLELYGVALDSIPPGADDE